MMVGEIRDLETAEIAIQASLTGHLVLSTIHTNDAPGPCPEFYRWVSSRFCRPGCKRHDRPALGPEALSRMQKEAQVRMKI